MKKDRYHDLVRAALEKEGWNITHDPYFLWLGRRKGYIDLGAEHGIIAAERGPEKIAVEIKSFTGPSDLDQFEDALGQFLIYLPALELKEPERKLILAVPLGFYNRFLEDPYFTMVAERYGVSMVVYNEKTKSIEKWIK